jgi:hypothetical protein
MLARSFTRGVPGREIDPGDGAVHEQPRLRLTGPTLRQVIRPLSLVVISPKARRFRDLA